ncbi:MAG: CAP domain-containing protein [Steroidobacteraceae bacterium]
MSSRGALLLSFALIAAQPTLADVFAGEASSARMHHQILQLVNEARSRSRRCGHSLYPAAAPLGASRMLDEAAARHAHDLADHRHFDHTGTDGSEPRDRVRASGYGSRLTGENIAFGPESAEEVVRGWLASPGHCANIMDARFRDMGFAVVRGYRRGHWYWVQVFAAPRRAVK